MTSILFHEDEDDEDEELMAFDLKKNLAAAVRKQHQDKEGGVPALAAEAATPSPGAAEGRETATGGGREENAPSHEGKEEEEEAEEEGDEYDKYEKMAEIVVEPKPSSLSQFCWAPDHCQVQRPCILLGKEEAAVFDVKPGHVVVCFFPLGRKAQYCSQCTKDELLDYKSGDVGETRAWSSRLVEEGRQSYHGPNEAWDKMMAEAEKALKDFIRREEEWGAVGVGSDGASSDVSEDEEEDKKVGSSRGGGGRLLEGITSHSCLQRGDRIMWYTLGRVNDRNRVYSNVLQVKHNPDKEDYPLEVHNHILGPGGRDKVCKVAEWKGTRQHPLEVPDHRLLKDFHLLTRMNKRRLPLDIVEDKAKIKMKKMLAQRKNDVNDKFNELFCGGETSKKRTRKHRKYTSTKRARESIDQTE